MKLWLHCHGEIRRPLDCLETRGPHVKYYNSIDYATDPGEPIFINSNLIFVNPSHVKCRVCSVLFSVCLCVCLCQCWTTNSQKQGCYSWCNYTLPHTLMKINRSVTFSKHQSFRLIPNDICYCKMTDSNQKEDMETSPKTHIYTYLNTQQQKGDKWQQHVRQGRRVQIGTERCSTVAENHNKASFNLDLILQHWETSI